jgi:predicted pyridoxine 5'-phosphate oxidase superfamily flavin-nucleotide-binding protein
MPLIDDDMRAIVRRSGIGYAATVTPDGRANLSPKGSLAVWDDDHLYFADIASPQTISNLRANPSIEVNFVDVISRRGYRFKGSAEVHESGPIFEKARQVLTETHGPQYPCNHAVLIKVETVAPLLSPAYVFNETPPSEEQMRAVWMRKLGVQPLSENGAGIAELSAATVEAYEKVLISMLGFRDVAELRDTFRRKIVQRAADQFDVALAEVRVKGQPEEFALPDAIERALLEEVEADVEIDLEQLFNDPNHHELPSDDVTRRITLLWDEVR